MIYLEKYMQYGGDLPLKPQSPKACQNSAVSITYYYKNKEWSPSSWC